MNIIRQYKLSLLGIVDNPFSDDLIDFLNISFKNLVAVKLDDYIDSIFYTNKLDDFTNISFDSAFHIPKKIKIAYVNYPKIWDVLQTRYNLEYSDIQDIFKFWINKEYHLNIEQTYSY